MSEQEKDRRTDNGEEKELIRRIIKRLLDEGVLSLEEWQRIEEFIWRE